MTLRAHRQTESRTLVTPETARDPAGSSAANPTDLRRWWILGVVGLAQVMVILDTTVATAINTATAGVRPADSGTALLR